MPDFSLNQLCLYKIVEQLQDATHWCQSYWLSVSPWLHFMLTHVYTSNTYPFSLSKLIAIPYTQSEDEALKRMHHWRESHSTQALTLLFPSVNEIVWGNDKATEKGEKILTPFVLAKSVARNVPKRFSTFYDRDFMKFFLNRSRLDCLMFDPTIST